MSTRELVDTIFGADAGQLKMGLTGRLRQNGTDESFNGKFRDECLSVEWFRSRREAKVIIETWRQHYNLVRPHSSLDYRTPVEFRRHHDSITAGAILK